MGKTEVLKENEIKTAKTVKHNKSKKKRIAVLTSGGDAPGMNAAVRAVVRTACANGFEVVGVLRGYAGLIRGTASANLEGAESPSLTDIIHGNKEIDLVKLDERSVSDIIHRGGTILYSARCKEFETDEGIERAIETCKTHNIVGIVVIGGDGSFRGAQDLANRSKELDPEHPISCIGIPATIDNDLGYTDYTLGYDTCLNTIMDMADRVRDTTESHDRCSVIEVMGRDAGFLALNAGIAVGAITILVPEIKYDITNDVILRIKETKKNTGKRHFIVVVAEGITDTCLMKKYKLTKIKQLDEIIPRKERICSADVLAKTIQKKTGVESRAVVFGHVQRGGAPTCKDRVVGSQMGYRAVKLLLEGKTNMVVGLKNESIFDMEINDALKIYKAKKENKNIDDVLFQISREISI